MTHDAFLSPLQGDEFLRTVFSKRSLVFAPKSALQSDPVWQERAWESHEALQHVDAASRDSEGQHTQERINPSRISEYLAAGFTICADITSYPGVRQWLGAAGGFLGTRPGGFAKLYASPKGHGFPMHLDPHHVFVLQCRGTKRWRYGRTPALPNARENAKVARGGAVFSGRYEGVPLHGGEGALPAPKDDELAEVVLGPGDALYLPPGTWHTACAEEFSLAISMSPPRLTPFDLIVQWLDGESLRHPEWFEDLTTSRTDIGDVLGAALKGTQTALRGAEVMTLARQWGLSFGERGATPGETKIERKDVLRRVVPLPMIESAEALIFFGAGQEWTLPLEARPFLEGLRSASHFVAEDALLWDENLRWPGAKELLEELIHAGVLCVSTTE